MVHRYLGEDLTWCAGEDIEGAPVYRCTVSCSSERRRGFLFVKEENVVVVLKDEMWCCHSNSHLTCYLEDLACHPERREEGLLKTNK